MKSIVSSQLTGKWYHIAGTCRRAEMYFMEIFLYMSMCNDSVLDVLFVGLCQNKSKIIKTLSLEITVYDESVFLCFKSFMFRLKLRILFFDEKNGIMILSDKSRKHLSIFSKKSRLSSDVVEKSLGFIDFFKSKDGKIKLYSSSIC